MIIYPAIDLIAGEIVRLHKGDFEQKTTYGTDPVSVARAYAEAGAAWLHLVDLDGAKDPANRQTGLIADIIAGSGLKVQTGGGIRSRADVEALLAAGASRVVIGSLAVRASPARTDLSGDTCARGAHAPELLKRVRAYSALAYTHSLASDSLRRTNIAKLPITYLYALLNYLLYLG